MAVRVQGIETKVQEDWAYSEYHVQNLQVELQEECDKAAVWQSQCDAMHEQLVESNLYSEEFSSEANAYIQKLGGAITERDTKVKHVEEELVVVKMEAVRAESRAAHSLELQPARKQATQVSVMPPVVRRNGNAPPVKFVRKTLFANREVTNGE